MMVLQRTLAHMFNHIRSRVTLKAPKEGSLGFRCYISLRCVTEDVRHFRYMYLVTSTKKVVTNSVDTEVHFIALKTKHQSKVENIAFNLSDPTHASTL